MFWNRYYEKAPEAITSDYLISGKVYKKIHGFVESKKEIFTIDLKNTLYITNSAMNIIKRLDMIFCLGYDETGTAKTMKFINVPAHLKPKLQNLRLEKIVNAQTR